MNSILTTIRSSIFPPLFSVASAGDAARHVFTDFIIVHCPFSIINYQKSLPSEIEQQGFPLFEIPLLSFARLPAEHKLYITLLLILTPLVLLRRVLAFSSSSALKDRAMGWLAWTINFSINLFIFHFHPHGILCKPLSAGG